MRSWANRVEAAEVWLLDDGSATLMVNDHRRAALGSSPTPPYPLTLNATRAQNVAARGLGLKLGHPGDVSFFTVYDIEPLATDRVVRNSYRWLKRTLSEPEPVEGSLLLGSPWVEDGIVELDVYLAGARVVARRPGPIQYAPHGRETAGKIERVLRETGADLAGLVSPVEYGVMRACSIPREIFAFGSTTLDTLPEVLPGGIRYFSIVLPPAVINEAYRSEISAVYRFQLRPGGNVGALDVPG